MNLKCVPLEINAVRKMATVAVCKFKRFVLIEINFTFVAFTLRLTGSLRSFQRRYRGCGGGYFRLCLQPVYSLEGDLTPGVFGVLVIARRAGVGARRSVSRGPMLPC